MNNSSVFDLIRRQTDYDEDTINEKLKEHDNNIEKIILEYNGITPDKKKKEKEITTNQKIFKAIRDNMNEIVPKSSQK